jgi:hypothetical protein
MRKLAILVALAGCNPSGFELAKNSTAVPIRMFASDSQVFWMTIDPNNVDQVLTVPLVGGTPTVLADAQPGQAVLGDLAIDASTVYWATGDGHIRSVPMAGGAISDLYTATGPTTIAVGNNTLYWFDSGALFELILAPNIAPNILTLPQALPYSLRVDSHALYWTDLQNDVVHRRALGGAIGMPIATLATGQDLGVEAPFNSILAIDSNNAYWFDNNTSSIVAAPLTGGNLTTLYARPGFSCISPVVDAQAIYCSEDSDVKRIPLDGSAASTIYTTSGFPSDRPILLALAGNYLVLASQNSIIRIPK